VTRPGIGKRKAEALFQKKVDEWDRPA